MVFAPVADVFSRVTSEMTVLQVQTEDGVRTLRLTSEHPAYVDTMGWVEARMLAPGDEIFDYDGNTPLTVISNTLEETTERVYNFEVSGTHTYFAGDVGAWVHNARIRGELRKLVFAKARDGLCPSCKVKMVFSGPPRGPRKDRFSCHHVIPQSKGGGDELDNLVPLCVSCNAKLGNK